ncbi:sensor histidine kinase [Pedobacter psychroterrae]|uniref:histidine kinase n=1 Tax=Pedobacter psychroterrae TaxID=2530453 RepID=A0A4R0NLC8_9SPHI|nr:HAMP domain-containing sensor histidine kinase [Pedobacter psychroterrae]TCD00323.1 HAMP domain-containing histidine kinase [Pedobacter psychroterrae]
MKKSSETLVLSRKILLAFLAFVAILAIAALLVRNNITNKLAMISDLTQSYNDKVNPEDALLLLHQAEDDFQASLLDTNSEKSTAYKRTLLLAFNKIDTLLTQSSDTSQLNRSQRKQAGLWYQRKIYLSERLFVLKDDFDSLLTVYGAYNVASKEGQKPVVVNTPGRNQTTQKTDTLKKLFDTGKKKGLFGRIKDAIVNKPSTTTGIIEINHNKQTKIYAESAQGFGRKGDKATREKLRRLQQSYGNLLDMQRRLIILNSTITSELERIVNELRDIDYQMTGTFKDMAFKNYKETTLLLNKFYLAALFLVLLFALLLIVFITQLNRSELLLRKENERSVNTARQKMDLLLHMSHEIRNPLTAIQGLLNVFSKTSLSERQTQMLKSIRRSSDMLLHTVNDTLDAAKMEDSQLKINTVAFNPDFTIQQVIESMSYSAEKKKLSLCYNFAGDKNALVLGDDFRLKQVLVNLLSNAIKYTPNGGITVQAELQNGDALQVDIVDTGSGISADQLPNLFSKYYQTSSSKGQVGTGLGLYICKQLIEMQGGKISVKSDPSKGTTFSFFIPYKK